MNNVKEKTKGIINLIKIKLLLKFSSVYQKNYSQKKIEKKTNISVELFVTQY